MFRKLTVLEFDWIDLPLPIRNLVGEWYGFANDVILPFRSEFEPCENDDGSMERWSDTLTRASVHEYYEDQSTQKDWESKMSFQSFVKNYGLEFEMWLIQQVEEGKLDLTGIDQIQVRVSW